jgi:hypothetical protein
MGRRHRGYFNNLVARRRVDGEPDPHPIIIASPGMRLPSHALARSSCSRQGVTNQRRRRRVSCNLVHPAAEVTEKKRPSQGGQGVVPGAHGRSLRHSSSGSQGLRTYLYLTPWDREPRLLGQPRPWGGISRTSSRGPPMARSHPFGGRELPQAQQPGPRSRARLRRFGIPRPCQPSTSPVPPWRRRRGPAVRRQPRAL